MNQEAQQRLVSAVVVYHGLITVTHSRLVGVPGSTVAAVRFVALLRARSRVRFTLMLLHWVANVSRSHTDYVLRCMLFIMAEHLGILSMLCPHVNSSGRILTVMNNMNSPVHKFKLA
jgi:hypothetical protein